MTHFCCPSEGVFANNVKTNAYGLLRTDDRIVKRLNSRITPSYRVQLKVRDSVYFEYECSLHISGIFCQLDFPSEAKEDHGLYSSVDPSSAISGALSLGGRSFAWTLGTLIWFLWTPKVNKIPLKKLGKIQIFVFLGTKMPIARALLGPNGRNFDTRTVGV